MAAKPFLDDKFHDQELEQGEYEASSAPGPRRRSWMRRHRTALLVHGLVVLVYVGLGISYWRAGHGFRACLCGPAEGLFSPAQDHVRTKVTVIHDRPSDIKASPYVGATSPEVDAAWYRLLRHHNIRITDDELRALNQTSIRLGHGGGSMGMMGVFHELHCLKLVREAVFADHYYADKTPAERAMMAGHTEHCIDILRSAAMCRADTAIFTYHWNDATRLPNPTWAQKHQCLDWELLEGWLEERRIDIMSPNLLVHPKYGPAYPGGKRVSEPDGPKVYPLDP
ncbi:hypothetical protein E4U42_000526 [Claviceps africana]|uniref:Tat pathway signal sequence n=1 Tax=Claviceps africana TaxID=83212 RepID=A0A8K0NE81_9HYPO|nr:hypothetical protein E4U42_000526 [Claviceps africana]